MDSLLKRALDGDKAAENEFFFHLRERFIYLIKYNLRGDRNYEDLAQEACLTILKKYKQENIEEGFNAWAYKILRNKIGNYLQKCRTQRNHRSDLSSDLADMHSLECIAGEEVLMVVRDCMRKLVHSYRRYARALNLIHLGFKVPEVCRRMHVNPNNLYVILSRGRSLLKNCLDTGAV